MAIYRTRQLLENNSTDLAEMLECLISLSEEKGYLIGTRTNHLTSSIEELNDLIKLLRDKVLSTKNNDN